MSRLLIPVLAAVIAAAATAGLALAGRADDDPGGGRGSPYAVGVWGDLPYSPEQVTSGVPNLVSDMNRQKLAFTVHDGDIKAGGDRCDQPVYDQFGAFLNSLKAPALYTPGDNEWTDCDRPAAGAYDSEERLALIRATFFDEPFSLGERRLRVEQQDAPYVENLRWRVGRVIYATLHVVGSDNNLGDVAPDPVEFAGRDAATNEWLRQTFAAAGRANSAAVFLLIQANPGFDANDPTRAPVRDPRTLLNQNGQPDGFTNFLRLLREETIAFRKPVVLVHGDSHYFRIDKPFQDEQGRRACTG